jgi:uncharacterized protein YggT (Ycf19 family)
VALVAVAVVLVLLITTGGNDSGQQAVKEPTPDKLYQQQVAKVFGPVLGPILGSIATEAYDWRAAFFMIVPPGICALICIWFALRDHTARTSVRFDWVGFIALSVAITAAQLILDRGHRLDWFESGEIILFAFIGLLWIRFIVDWVQVFARRWEPRGPLLVALEGVYSATDPPIVALRRVIPPLRIGQVALDLSFLLVMVAAWLLLNVVRTIFNV